MTRMAVLAVVVLVTGFDVDSATAQKNPKKKKVKGQPRGIQRQIRQQDAIFGRTFSQNAINLLRNQKVQQELKLDADQKSELKVAIQKLAKNRQAEKQKLRGLKGREAHRKMHEQLRKFDADSARKAKEILEPKQHTRLREILVQVQGVRIFESPKFQVQLKITDDQKKKLADIRKAGAKNRRKVLQDSRAGGKKVINYKKYQQKIEEALMEQEKKTLEVLTKEQQAQFRKMTGKKFELPLRQGFRAIGPAGIRLRFAG